MTTWEQLIEFATKLASHWLFRKSWSVIGSELKHNKLNIVSDPSSIKIIEFKGTPLDLVVWMYSNHIFLARIRAL